MLKNSCTSNFVNFATARIVLDISSRFIDSLISEGLLDLARYSKEYIAGVESFLDFATVMEILKARKFSVHVQSVIYHREWDIKLNVDDDMDCSRDDIDGLLNDQFRGVAHVEGVYDGPNGNAKKLYNLVEEASQELYPELFKEVMPELNIPPSYNKTKFMVKNLGLDYDKIDACPNDCMLFRNDHKDDEFCHTCGSSRYIKNTKVDSETTDSLKWHDEERSKHGKLRHPADGQAWKDFDRLHPDFALDSRNVRLGLASDGFNPFRTMSISHSTWQNKGSCKSPRGARRKTQNSGVTLVASTTSFASSKDKNLIAADLTYYGRIVDIVELDYYGHFKEEPFVPASQVHQCFYVQDPYDQDRHYVMRTYPRNLFNMSDQVANLPQNYENELSEHLMGPSMPKDNETIIDVPSKEFVTEQLEVEIEEDLQDESEDEIEGEFENEYEDESGDKFEDDSEHEYEDES
ncbi:hypothetical protein KY285_032870 [Solanum tuberosum]|nr:hypothetical protein KY285_032870 [Solanum tuberosum]